MASSCYFSVSCLSQCTMIWSTRILTWLPKHFTVGELLPSGVLIVVFALVIVSFWKQRKVAFLPGPTPLPIIGNAHQIAPQINRFVHWLTEILDKYGGISTLWIGNNLAIATNDMDLIKNYYQSPQANANFQKDTFRGTASYALGEGLLTATGPHWQFTRKTLSPTFAPTLLKNFVSIFEKNATIFADNLDSRADGKPFSIYYDICLCTFYTINETFLQVDKSELPDPKDAIGGVETMMHLMQNRGYSPWQRPDVLFHLLPPGRLAVKTMKELMEYLDIIYQTARHRMNNSNLEGENEWKKKIYINTLMSDGGYSHKQILDELGTIILAGYETTSSAIGFLYMALAQHPEIQEKIIEEDQRVQKELAGRELEYSDLAKYSYLDRVIKEGLRLFPVVPVYHRRLSENLKHGDSEIPAGAELLIHVLSLHRNPEQFPDPLKFDPDRFLPENIAKRHPYSYIPFSMGGRMCLGWRFSSISMKTMTLALLRRFKLSSKTPLDEIKTKVAVTLKDLDEFVISLERR